MATRSAGLSTGGEHENVQRRRNGGGFEGALLTCELGGAGFHLVERSPRARHSSGASQVLIHFIFTTALDDDCSCPCLTLEETKAQRA